jgi:serine/threonine-protein kinase HipA
MMRKLNVFLADELVGQLEQDASGRVRFGYDPGWLESKTASPLSASLPLRPERFRWRDCRPFFAGLLPEDESRELIAKALGISDRNDFALLERIGAECAGAVSILRPEDPPLAIRGEYREITSDELAHKIAELPRRPLLAGEDRIRLSLAGAQGKLPVMIRDGKFSLPLDGSPSSHILKPQSPHSAGLVGNEFFCMRLASRAGLEVAAVEIAAAGGTKFLQVERFDRKRLPGGAVERIHQEDFCQALGVPPELKYQQEGGPSLKKCFDLVRAVSTVSGPDILKLFDAVVFNALIGNCDAHGKNFSFIYEQGSARLSPLYDLVCTRAYPNLSQDMAMKIGDERNPLRVTAKSWRKFFKEAGFGEAAAGQRLLNLVRRVERETEAMAAQDTEGAGEVAPIILSNCGRLISL